MNIQVLWTVLDFVGLCNSGNIRRYVDNAPLPEPHDVRAHLYGGVPKVEVESLAHFWQNYPQLKDGAFVERDEAYLDFAPVLADKRAVADFVASHQSVTDRHEQFMQTLEAWWQESLPIVEALAPDADNQEARPRNVYVAYSGPSRSPIPAQADHPFRAKPITDSGASRSPFRAKPITFGTRADDGLPPRPPAG